MAKMLFKAGEDYAIKLSNLAKGSDTIAKKAVYEGAAIVADAIKSNLADVLSGDSTGELYRSLGISPIDVDYNGNWSAKVGFDGYSGKPYKGFPRGTPNQLKARVLESGSSKQMKKPFVRPAVNMTKRSVVEKMNKVIQEEIKKLDL